MRACLDAALCSDSEVKRKRDLGKSMPRLKQYLTADGVNHVIKLASAKSLYTNKAVACFLKITERTYQYLVSAKEDQTSISVQVRNHLSTLGFTKQDFEFYTSNQKRQKARRDAKHVAQDAGIIVRNTPIADAEALCHARQNGTAQKPIPPAIQKRLPEPATHKDAEALATLADARTTYKRTVATTSNTFSVFITQLDVFEPISLARHLDGPILELLRYASTAMAVLVARPRIKDASLAWSRAKKKSFVFLSFVAMVRGYLLDRFVARKDLAPEVLPTLPELSVLERRWYENVLLENRWLHDWSDGFSRDLVDAQWPTVERELSTLPHSDVLPMPILMDDLKRCMLLGMVARRFLMLADSPLSQ